MANIKIPENEKKKQVTICLTEDQIKILKSFDMKDNSCSRAVSKLIELIKNGEVKWK